MANTYTQLHIQIIFAVQDRKHLIKKEWKGKLYKYITGVVQKNGHKMICINGVSDHIHILIGLRPAQSLSDLVKAIKQGSSWWINHNNLMASKFIWQVGYGAFSYSKSHLPTVIRYIQKQESHHALKTFKQEYIEFLEAFEIDYEEKYIFKEV